MYKPCQKCSGKTKEYRRQGSQSVTSAAPVTLIEFVLTGGEQGALTRFANYSASSAAWGSITWIVKINGVPIPPFNEIRDSIGSMERAEDIGDEASLSPGSKIEVIAISTTTTPYIVGAICHFAVRGSV